MGACSETQLEELPKHSVGLPKNFEWHPFKFIDFKEQAMMKKQPVGRDPRRVSTKGQRFYMDNRFMGASNEDYTKPSTKTDSVIESFHECTSYLLIVDE
jgi:hypothetical protein